jgi:hypothetical protein
MQCRAESDGRWRSSAPNEEALEAVAMWFEDFIDDALYLERRAQRYGLG